MISMANRLRLLSRWMLACAAVLAACDGGDPGDPFKVNAAVQGFAYVDWDLDGRFTPLVDGPAGGVTTALIRQGTSDTVARAVAGPTGLFFMRDVPVGRYTLVAGHGASIGDSLQVMPIDSADIVLAAGDTATREVRLSFATITIGALADVPIGLHVAIEGVAINSFATFGDSTIHLVDPTGYTRAVRLRPTVVNEGDSIRVFGTSGNDQGGRHVLLDGTARVLAPGRQVPPPASLSTAAVATAANGTRAYALARITGANIVDTATTGGNRLVGVNDGSGRVELVLDGDIAFNFTNLVPNATVAATGVLAPTTGLSQGGEWQLKPRKPIELTITFPTVTVAAARASAPDTKVSIEGLALSAWNVFGDSSVHLRDASGAIRGVRVVPSNVAAGDSIRLLGTMGTRNGQPVVTGASASRLLGGVGLPEPDSVSTAVAASASAGRRDADLVRIAAQIVGTSTLPPNQDLEVKVDDGSGQLVVIFDRNAGFNSVNTSSVVPGAILSARGVLVPTGTGTWRLLPRNLTDFSAVYPTVTIANARTLDQGKIVYIYGIAITGAATFASPVVHVTDGSAAIRVLQVSSGNPIFPGDSVRVLGTVTVNLGQPAINSSTAEVQLANVGVPPATTLSTAAAARADGGTRDAALVRTSGTIKAVRTDSTVMETLLDVDDGSGIVVVRLDRGVGFTGTWNVNDLANVTGVLSPAGDGTWVIKPRRVADLTVTPAG
jgi:hypothetical protein